MKKALQTSVVQGFSRKVLLLLKSGHARGELPLVLGPLRSMPGLWSLASG